MISKINRVEVETMVELEMMKREMEVEAKIIEKAEILEEIAQAYDRCALLVRKYDVIIEKIGSDVSG